jgi:acyltransferase-like protein
MTHVRRIRGLDGLRGLAAIAVMLFHFNLFFLPQAQIDHVVPFVGRAYLAVDLFFLLSGFVMAHVYGRLLTSDRRAHWLLFSKSPLCPHLSIIRSIHVGHVCHCRCITHALDMGLVFRSFAGAPAFSATTMGFRPELGLSVLVN